MENPSDKEINRTIAEFMGLGIEQKIAAEWYYRAKGFGPGGEDYGWVPVPKYTSHLNLLIPVWEKLTATKITMVPRIGDEGESSYVEIETFATRIFLAFADPLEKAAALATYQTINEIRPE